MSESKPMPKWTQAEIDEKNKDRERHVLITFEGKIYDVVDYYEFHPGGGELITDVVGQHVEKEIYDEKSHPVPEDVIEEMSQYYIADFVKEEKEIKEKKETKEKQKKEDKPEQKINIGEDAKVNKLVFLEFNIALKDGKQVGKGRIDIELFGDVPITSNNFKCLCTGEKMCRKSGKYLSFKGNKLHRIVPQFMIQGGDITVGDGTGGQSIYGMQFDDENFKHKHDEPFMLSMANTGKNSNTSQFFITCKKAPWLDGNNVAFGKVIKNTELILDLTRHGGKDGKPFSVVTISDCGEIKKEDSKPNEKEPNEKKKKGWFW